MTTRSEARKKEWRDPVIRAKRLKRSGMLGKRHSAKTKKAWSKKRKGIHASPKTEFKKGGRKPKGAYIFPKGEKNPAWSGGVYRTLRQKIMKLPEYRCWRKGVFKRDGYICQCCLEQRGVLHANHLKPYIKIIKEFGIKTPGEAVECLELWNIDNGQTLCEECHFDTPTYGYKVHSFL